MPVLRFTLLTIGSQGDVEPCIALAKALRKRGHHPRIASMASFRGYVEGEGIEFLKIAGDAKLCIELLIGRNVGPRDYFKGLERLLDPIADELFRDLEAACEDTDLIAYSVLGSVAYHAAQARGLPSARMLFVPMDPTREFPAMTAPYLGRAGAYNKLTYAVGDLLWSRITRKRLSGWRASLGLGAIRPFEFPYREDAKGGRIPTLYAFSERIVPKPADWGDHVKLTGYWFGEEAADYVPEEGLARFLGAGPTPVYVGFGSMTGGDFRGLLAQVIEGLELAGLRAVISSGWGGLSGADLPPTVYQAGFVPHSWLFKRVAAVVHHGGAGTVAAGIRAGVPTLVVPFGGDQPFWGRRVSELGLGPKALPIGRFSPPAFASALREAVESPAYRRNAIALARELGEEDGPAKAALILEEACREKSK